MNAIRLFAMLVVGAGALAQGPDPIADPAAVVTAGDVRFTVLTPSLVRMEWAENGRFEDHPSLLFLNRRLPVPPMTKTEKDGYLTLTTERLALRYRVGSGRFTAENLEIRLPVAGNEVRWVPGIDGKGNLKGTIRTLDGVEGAIPLEDGILSRDGWAVVDDSARPLFDSSDWSWVQERPAGARQDLYFFGYGHDYRGALFDFTRVAGKIPMPPRFAFGLWWSRYWGYTDEEFKQLVGEFETHSVPLDVLVIDMDWHLTFNMRWDHVQRDQAGQTLGWTGYTWDRNNFPDPDGFLAWCAQKGLRTPLNLHPASGIQPHEEQYPAMARAMGIDPSTRKYVPFDIVDKKFATNYLQTVIHPLEKQGVDFWWLDWQQWGTTRVPAVTPTWWLNYVFFTDMERQNRARPLLFHRWGGLGNHRYQIGFSGDVISVWESLKFQPYFTATASNVGFGYWSHDIGGHMPGPITPELYTRWIQWGAFSPILRTHTTKNPGAERRIWAYPTEAFLTMRDAIRLRYALIPYIYTMAREAYDTGLSLCRPMYYAYPESPEAYSFTGQYQFGDAMIVAPVTAPVDSSTMFARVAVWLPAGEWVEWFTGARLRGPAVYTRKFARDEIPVYVRAGSVIPMQPVEKNAGMQQADPLVLTLFPGGDGNFSLYEDAGNTSAYRSGEFCRTALRWTGEGSRRVLSVDPPEGSAVLQERRYELRVVGVMPPGSVTCNGKRLDQARGSEEEGWTYDGLRGELCIRTEPLPTPVTVTLEGVSDLPVWLQSVRGMLARLHRVMPLLNNLWPKEWSPEHLIAAAQTGNRMSVAPARAAEELYGLRAALPKVREEIAAMKIDSTLKARVLEHLRGTEE
jgi:alpha-glucosidase (family GH31 glycosyl hydrolase)